MKQRHVIPPRLLTFPETCEKLRCSKPKLYRLVNAGQLRLVKIGASTRFLESDVAELIDAGIQQPG